jgi:ribosomal protein L11 methyltransferase
VAGAAAAAAVAAVLDQDAQALASFETAEDSGLWQVDAYAEHRRLDARCEVAIALAATAAGGTLSAVAEAPVDERDWLEATRHAFPPLRIGRFLVHGSHWRPPARTGAVAIEIDAANAFGTGEHPSTRGCLLALDRLARHRRSPRAVRDVGTGSGILAIAAAKLWRRPVSGSDIDAASVRVARLHARRNGVAAWVRLDCAPGYRGRRDRGGHYDLVFANILARPLAALARDLARALAPGGVAVLSGLLRRQEPIVLAPHRGLGLHLSRRIEIDGWSTLVLHKGR